MDIIPPVEDISERLLFIYDRLLQCYGAQHWWPADGDFEIVVGAILTQMTTWSNVEKAIDNLKSHNLLSPAALYQIPTSEIAEEIYSTGFYKSKARKIKAFVTWLHDYYNDSLDGLFTLPVLSLREILLSVYGIGEETADSIILYAARKPVFVVDAYTRRIMQRIGINPGGDSYHSFQALFMGNLPVNEKTYNEYHALFVRHGKERCRARPDCAGCCLSAICSHRNSIVSG